MQETDLLKRLKNGDENAFRELVERYGDRVYNVALNLAQNTDDADDITQEVFVNVFSSIASFRADASLSTWLYRITLNKCLDHRKKQQRKTVALKWQGLFGFGGHSHLEPAEPNHPGLMLEKKEQGKALMMALKKLPQKQEMAFSLHKLNGLSYKEVAEVLNLSIPSVESLMTRANKNLRNILAEYYLSAIQ